jgi:hypothetical protein
MHVALLALYALGLVRAYYGRGVDTVLIAIVTGI